MIYGNLFYQTRFLLIKQSGYVLRNPKCRDYSHAT